MEPIPLKAIAPSDAFPADEKAAESLSPPPGHRRIRFTIAFDGTAYQGWQRQKTGVGVQEKVEQALARLFPAAPILHGSSRTDAGVHALGLTAHADIPAAECRIPMRRLPLALNAHLPEDIRVLEARRCPPGFHARFSATGKEYRYQVWNRPAMNPLLRTQAWHVPRALNLEAVRRAAQAFAGKHDFLAFSANPGYARRFTARTIYECSVRRRGGLWTFVIRGDGFLYRMCRGIVGTLVQVGLGRFAPEDIPAMLASRDRRLAGMSAPPHGLILWRVFYGSPPKARAAAE